MYREEYRKIEDIIVFDKGEYTMIKAMDQIKQSKRIEYRTVYDVIDKEE